MRKPATLQIDFARVDFARVDLSAERDVIVRSKVRKYKY
jgi:hypothetical protein